MENKSPSFTVVLRLSTCGAGASHMWCWCPAHVEL